MEADPVFANSDNMFMSRPERYRHGLRKARRFTALKSELKLRCLEHSGLVGRACVVVPRSGCGTATCA